MMREMQERTVGELAAVVQGRVYGDPLTIIRGIASIEEARLGDITFAESSRFLEPARLSSASAILAPNAAINNSDAKVMIGVDNPRLAFAQLLDLFAPELYIERGIAKSAVVGGDFRSGENLAIGANCVVGENVRIGRNVTIYPLCYIGDDCEIGDDTILHPNVTILRGSIIGSRVTIHSGTVLGADGFGYITTGGKHQKVPQIGHVQICDDVEIGANCTIDRAKTGVTKIGNGTKLDNQVHIAHNCQIGQNVLIVAQVGIAGGVQIGDYAVIAGQSGIKEQVKIGPRAVLAAGTGAIKDVEADAFVSGFPARPHRDFLKQQAALGQLPEILKQFRQMEKRVKELEAKLGQ
jgi:UDP-3-O-[3-hydroxymyristoyl] glucosamine N-acyltransferase